LMKVLPDKPTGFAPPITDRAAWDSPEMKANVQWLLDIAEDRLANQKMLPWDDEAYLEFSRSGDRSRGGGMMGSRRHGLIPCVYAECFENKGRFLPWILERLEGAASDPSWTDPAHDHGLGSFKGTRENVDLVSTRMADILATTLHMLGDRVPDELRARLMEKMEKRIWEPMKVAIHSPDVTQFWTRRTNNWNSVCWRGVVGSTLALHPDKEFRAQIVASALASVRDAYLAGFEGDDGYCVEGVGYWNYGFSNFIALREKIWQATDGKFDLFDDPKVAQIALFGIRTQLTDEGTAPPYGDCPLGARPDMKLVRYVNHAMSLNSPGIEPYAKNPALAEFYDIAPRSLARPKSTGVRPASAFDSADTPAPKAAEPLLGHYFPDATVLISRAPAGERVVTKPGLLYFLNKSETKRIPALAAAIKAGGNGSHSHDDIGSYVIMVGKEQVTGDLGGPRQYIADTFNANRYKNPVMNSYSHPVPVVAGKLQSRATSVKPKVLKIERTAELDTFHIDMRPAYDVPELVMLERIYRFDRTEQGRGIMVIDKFEFTEPQTFETALIANGEWKQLDTKKELEKSGTSCACGPLWKTHPEELEKMAMFTFTRNGEKIDAYVQASAPIEIVTDTITNATVTDTRIGIRFREPQQKGHIAVNFSEYDNPPKP